MLGLQTILIRILTLPGVSQTGKCSALEVSIRDFKKTSPGASVCYKLDQEIKLSTCYKFCPCLLFVGVPGTKLEIPVEGKLEDESQAEARERSRQLQNFSLIHLNNAITTGIYVD